MDFMMPVQGAMPGELPPGLPPQGAVPPAAVVPPQVAPAVPQPVAQPVPPQAAPAAPPPEIAQQQAQAAQGLLQDEGAQGPSQSGEGFFDKLRGDPKISQAMMMMGLRMMQGAKPGQDTMGLLGDAMMAGAAAHNMLRYNEQDNARKDAEFSLKKNESEARVASSQATTAETLQRTAQSAETFPETKKKLVLEIQRLKSEGRSAEAKALAEEFRADPERLAESWKLDVASKQANINQSNAAAGASASSARANDALTENRKLENTNTKTLTDPNATEEQKEAARLGLNKGKTDRQTGKDQVAMYTKLIQDANPGMTSQQVAAEVQKLLTTAKTDDVRTAERVLLDPSSYDPATVASARLVVATRLKTAASPTKGAPAEPAQAPAAGAKVLTEADITAMMHKHGKTRQAVLAEAKRQGYTVQGQ